MNPHEWKDAIERLQRHLEPNRQSAVNSSVGNTSTSSNNWNTYCDYTTRYTTVEPHGSNVGWMDPSPASLNVYRKDSKLEEPDGEVVEMNDDEELVRKRQQLREIEERIIHKKASIALKSVGQLVNKTTADVSCEGETLRERVNVILQRRCPLGFHSKVQSCKDRTNSNLSKESLLQEQHPLKLRVKAVMKHRSSNDCIQLAIREEAPAVTLPPPSQSLTSSAKEENKGFERFLSILNKGVDINMLSRIVNDDRVDLPVGGELLNIQSSAVEKKSDSVFRSESQQSNSRTNSSETKTDSLTERLSLPEAEEKDNDKGHHSSGSSSRSKSPPAAKKKKKEEEEKPKVDEKQAQLQNILKTLGLSLEVEEMSKLADRTQERLYGKKIVDRQSTDSKEEQESQQRGSNRDSSSSSSSSSSSYSSSSSRSSSRSTSRSFSRSPSPRQRHDDSRVSEEAQDRQKDGINSHQMSAYQHPYTQNQTFPFPHPPPAAFPGYGLLPYSHYTNNQSAAYSAPAHPLWSQPPIPYPNFPPPIVPVHNTTFHRQRERCLENLITFECPDLAESEGQGESASRPSYLQAVRTVQPSSQPCLKHIIGNPKRKRNRKKTAESKKNRRERKRLLKQERELRESAQKAETSQGSKDDPRYKQSNEEKQQLTDQEIKANLRKRLTAFNQKAKHSSQLLQSTVMQPANSLVSEDG